MILSNIKDIQNNFQQNENFSYLKLMMFQLSAYSENKYTVYRSVVLKNNTLATVDTIFISKLQFLIFLIIFINILLHFHYFISLETANTQSEVFLLRISLGSVNASAVTCRYTQSYNFSFGEGFLETLVSVFIQDFNRKFYNTFYKEQSHQLRLLLVVSQ